MRFAVVGSFGFLLDALFVAGLILSAGWDPIPARLVSFVVVVAITWWLNRQLTFRTARQPAAGPQYARYFMVQIVGWLTNLGFFVGTLSILPPILGVPFLSLIAGAAAGLCVNYIGAKQFAFRTDS